MLPLAVVALTAAGCSSVDTAPNQTALHYQNGPVSSRIFESCVPSSTLEYHKVNDDYFYYPQGQRTLNFAPGGDLPPLTITSRDGQVMDVSAIVAFHLDTSCAPFTDRTGKHWPGGILQKFHESIASQDVAYAVDGGGEPGPGWDKLLVKYLAAPIERSVSNEALRFDWLPLFTDATAKAEWEHDSVAKIPQLIQAQTGEPYFHIDSILVQRPDPNQALKAGLADNQAAHLRATTAQTDQQAAASFPGGVDAYARYQQLLAVNKAITDGKVQIIPVPLGSPVIVGGGK